MSDPWCRVLPRRGAEVLAAFVLMSFVVLPLPAGATAADVGYVDFSYSASGVSDPTGQKPQSKLWHDGGRWWGALFSRAAGSYTIHRLDRASQEWIDTGVVVEERNSARLDALFDGQALYVVSAGTSESSTSASIRVGKWTFDPGLEQYQPVPGFPITVANGGTEVSVIDMDSSGALWVSFTQGEKVFVTHSASGNHLSWTTASVLPFASATTLTTDDIAALVSFDSRIGVMWSNQNDDTMHFAYHEDGAPDAQWTMNNAVSSPDYADDHINLKSLVADPSGRVFAATKTSLDHAGSGAPLTLLLILGETGNWSRRTFGTVADDHTRPIVLIDTENRRLYMLATAPVSGGKIYYKSTSLDSISFSSGRGDVFIGESGAEINNVSSTKQTLDNQSGLVAIASDDNTDLYYHNDLGAGPGPPFVLDTVIESGPAEGSVGPSSAMFGFSGNGAGFECRLDGGTWAGCISPASYSALADGEHIFEVRSVDGSGGMDSSPATRSWTVSSAPPGSVVLVPVADSFVEQGSPSSNYGSAKKLEVDGASGSGGTLVEALVRFDVSGVSGAVSSARLRVYVTNRSSSGPEVFRSATTWVESGVTWNNRPARFGAAVADVGSIGKGWLEIDVTSAVTGNGLHSFTFAPTSTDGADFYSREHSRSPQLIIDYQPGGGGNQSPVADAGVDRSVVSGNGLPVTVSLNGSGSSDQDGSVVTWSWVSDTGISASGVSPNVSVPVGVHVFTLTVTDDGGATATDTVTVTVTDGSAPPPGSVVLVPVADSFVEQGSPSSNYGSAKKLEVDGASGSGGTLVEALVRFDVSGVSGAVSSARLRVYVTNRSSSGPEVFRSATTWVESGVTWNNRPARFGAAVADVGSIGKGWLEIDVTSAVTGNGLHSFTFAPTSTDGADFYSREHSRSPQLIIEYQPAE